MNRSAHTSNSVTRSCDELGATLIEATIAVPALLFWLIISIDLILIGGNALSLQFIATRTMRKASIPNANDEAGVQSYIINQSRTLGIPLTDADISMCRIEDAPCEGMQLGEPRDLMLLTLESPPQGFVISRSLEQMLGISLHLEAQVVGRIEPE